MRERRKIVTGIDGLTYSPEVEAELNSLVHACFTSPAGERVLQYLRNITLNRVLGPEATPCALRHMEGSRFIVAILEKRIHAARDPSRSDP